MQMSPRTPDRLLYPHLRARARRGGSLERLRRRKLAAPDDVFVIVADPRRTETADLADLHLALRPDSDVALVNGMLHVLRREGQIDGEFIARHTVEWAALAGVLEDYPPERAAALTGLAAEAIVRAARRFGDARAARTLWNMGLDQSHVGTGKNSAILNLHLATRQIGRAGAGPFSLTGQPNAMGGREAGGLADVLPGYRKVTDPIARRTVEEHWSVPPGTISTRPGRSAPEIFEGMPDLDTVERALRQADLVIVQDAYHPTETTRFADVLLPAAPWPEKDGVMTSSERRLTYLPRLAEPAGEARPDVEILVRFAHEMGWKAAFPYEGAAEIFDELAALTAGTPCDYSGVSHRRLRTDGPLQWPVPAATHPGTARLYTEGVFPTPDGRARFVAVEHVEPLEPVA